MSDAKTLDQGKQWAADIVNDLMERSQRYRISRHIDEPSPDFSGARWYLGVRQRCAIGYCVRAIGGANIDQSGGQFMGFPVAWVQENDHAELVERKG